MTRNIECKCDSRFTCGYCLRNIKPYHFTLSDGSAIYETRVQRGELDMDAELTYSLVPAGTVGRTADQKGGV